MDHPFSVHQENQAHHHDADHTDLTRGHVDRGHVLVVNDTEEEDRAPDLDTEAVRDAEDQDLAIEREVTDHDHHATEVKVHPGIGVADLRDHDVGQVVERREEILTGRHSMLIYRCLV